MTAAERAKAALCLGERWCNNGSHDYECCYSHGGAERVEAAIEAAEDAVLERALAAYEKAAHDPCDHVREAIRATRQAQQLPKKEG